MVNATKNHVRLSPADWCGLGSFALTLLVLVGATLYQVHDMAAEDRARQTRFETELSYLKTEVRQLQQDVRALLRIKQ